MSDFVRSGDAIPATADVVIVGAGSAGCVLADKLSRDAARSVLLLEQGPVTWPGDDVLDLRRLPIGEGEPYVTHHLADPSVTVVRGRGLGGSSVVNGGYFLRWHADDFAGWLTGWDLTDVDAAYRELDDPDGTMRVRPFADSELADTAIAFERYWAERLPVRPPADRWPTVGVNRVLSNSIGGRPNGTGSRRRTAAEAYLRPAVRRSSLTVCAQAPVEQIITSGRDIVGVAVAGTTVRCDEVILCAGTLGTAGLLLRSGLEAMAADPRIRVYEHRELLVGYRRRDRTPAGPLLSSVVHTPDELEIRCYNDDFASYVSGLPPQGQAIGICAMRPGGTGEVRLADGRLRLDLDPVDADTQRRMAAAAADVESMLGSREFADLVVEGSVHVDPVIRTSQHAWGSAAMGRRTDWLGGVYGMRGLRIVDGSILPTAGRSGPHATTMMLACRIGDVLAAA